MSKILSKLALCAFLGFGAWASLPALQAKVKQPGIPFGWMMVILWIALAILLLRSCRLRLS
jgi:hypothetical protein